MTNRTLKPIIVWLGHTYRSEDTLRNFKGWLKNSKSKLLEGRAYNLSVNDEQKEIEDLQYKFFEEFSKKSPLAVFLIVDWETFKLDYVKQFINKVNEVSRNSQSRTYTILLDDLEQTCGANEKIEIFDRENELVGLALPCHCQHQMTVIGTRRCVNLLERIMGYDIGDGKNFPYYSEKMLMGVTRHINRENFNKRDPRIGAWEKYSFTNCNIPIIPKELL